MESLMPDFLKITKAKRTEEVVLIHANHLALNPFQTQTHIYIFLSDKESKIY
jgi:hypothetical protein